MYFVSRCYFFYKIIESVQQGTQFKNFIFLKVKTSKQFYACLLCMLNSKNLETSTNRNHVKLIYIVSFSIIQIGITGVPCDSWSSNYLRKVKGWRDGYCTKYFPLSWSYVKIIDTKKKDSKYSILLKYHFYFFVSMIFT